MFNGRAFRTWGHVLLGACVVAGLFLTVMLMVEEVVGQGARLSRAAVTVTSIGPSTTSPATRKNPGP